MLKELQLPDEYRGREEIIAQWEIFRGLYNIGGTQYALLSMVESYYVLAYPPGIVDRHSGYCDVVCNHLNAYGFSVHLWLHDFPQPHWVDVSYNHCDDEAVCKLLDSVTVEEFYKPLIDADNVLRQEFEKLGITEMLSTVKSYDPELFYLIA